MDGLDELLRSADPAAESDDLDVDRFLQSLSTSPAPLKSEKVSGRRWRRLPMVLASTAIASVVLAGAAIFAPLQLWIDDEQVPIDLRLPIRYTTASGENIECTIGLSIGSAQGRTPEIEAAIPRIREKNWEGIGDRIYEYAVEHPHTRQEGEVWTEEVSRESLEVIAFQLATMAVIGEDLSGILPEGAGAASTSDCPGRLS